MCNSSIGYVEICKIDYAICKIDYEICKIDYEICKIGYVEICKFSSKLTLDI